MTERDLNIKASKPEEITKLAKRGCSMCSGTGLVVARKNLQLRGGGSKLDGRKQDFCGCALKRWAKREMAKLTPAERAEVLLHAAKERTR